MHGKILEFRIDDQAEKEPERTEQQADHQQLVSIDRPQERYPG